MDQQDSIRPQTDTRSDARAKADTANNGGRSRVDGDGGSRGATQLTNAMGSGMLL